MAYDAHFAFAVDSKIKKRYFQLSKNGHLHPSFMAEALRTAFNKVIAEAEHSAGLVPTVEYPTSASDNKPNSSQSQREPKPYPSSLKENSLRERVGPQADTSAALVKV